MSEFDKIKRTRIASAPIVDVNSSATQSFFDLASKSLSMSQEFGAEAKKEAAKAGKMAGQNSIAINPDGTVSRAAVGDAGRFYTESFMDSQRVAAKGALETSIRQRAQEFLIENQNNPDALAKFDTEFREGYLKPLVTSLNKDIQGQVGVIADTVYKGTLNTLSDTEMARQFEASKKSYADAQTNDLNTLNDLYATGQMEQAAALEEKMYGDAQEASGGEQSILTVAGVELLNKNMMIAKQRGTLIKDTSNMGFIEAISYLDKYRQTPDTEMGPEDRELAAQAAQARVDLRYRRLDQVKQAEAKLFAPKLHDAQVELDELRRKGNVVTPDVVDKIYQKNGLYDSRKHEAVWESYARNQNFSDTQMKELRDERVSVGMQYINEQLKSRQISYAEAMRSPFYRESNAAQRAVLRNSNFAIITKDLERVGTNKEVYIQKAILVGGFTEDHLEVGLARAQKVYNETGAYDSEGAFWVDNAKSIMSQIVAYKKSPAFKYHEAQSYIAQNKPIPANLHSAFDTESQKEWFDGSYDPTNPEHLKRGLALSIQAKRLPSYVSDGLKNWKRILPNQDLMRDLVVGIDQLSGIHNGGLLGEIPSDVMGPNNSNFERLAASVTLDPDEYKKFIGRYDTLDTAGKERILEGLNYVSENGMPTQAIRDVLGAELKKVMNNTSGADDVVSAMAGGSFVFKRLLGWDASRYAGVGITPDSMKGMFSTDGGGITEGAVRALSFLAEAEAVGGNSNHPVRDAFDTFAQGGGGFSSVTSFGGEMKVVTQSPEQLMQNQDIKVAPWEYVQMEIMDHLDELQSKAGTDDQGPDTAFSRLFDGSLGEDLTEQLGEQDIFFNDMKRMWEEGDIKLSPVSGRAGAFEVSFRLGAKDGDDNRKVVTLGGYLQIGPGSHGIVSRETLRRQFGRGEVNRALRDPSTMFNTFNTTRFDANDRTDISLRQQAFERSIEINMYENGGDQ